MKWTVPLLGVLMMVASCATVPTPATENAPSPLPGRGTTSTSTTGTSSDAAARPAPPSSMPQGAGPAKGSGASARSLTRVDSLPSREALEVLKSIPEPLPPGERVPAPPRSALAADPTVESAADSSAAPADSAAADSSGADSRSDAGQVPIPSPTVPLGDRQGSLTRPADTLATSPGGGATGRSPSTPAGNGAAPAPGAKAPPAAPPALSAAADSCWRIQVAAKPEAARAQALRDAAQSQLLVPMVIEIEKGLHKVRSRDCLGAAAAERLRHRALAAGFAGTFRYRATPK